MAKQRSARFRKPARPDHYIRAYQEIVPTRKILARKDGRSDNMGRQTRMAYSRKIQIGLRPRFKIQTLPPLYLNVLSIIKMCMLVHSECLPLLIFAMRASRYCSSVDNPLAMSVSYPDTGFYLTDILATGGCEAVINLWHDSNAVDKAEETEKEDEVVFVRKYDAKDQNCFESVKGGRLGYMTHHDAVANVNPASFMVRFSSRGQDPIAPEN
ncbi:hypothetical protein Tco_0761205, partial [Tanacetum coccineum]